MISANAEDLFGLIQQTLMITNVGQIEQLYSVAKITISIRGVRQ